MFDGSVVAENEVRAVLAPHGGRILSLSCAVHEGRLWDVAVRAAASRGKEAQAGIDLMCEKKFTKQYPRTKGAKRTPEQLVACHFGHHLSSARVVSEYARRYALMPASPRAVFAIAERIRELPGIVNMPSFQFLTLVPTHPDSGDSPILPGIWFSQKNGRVPVYQDRGWALMDAWFVFCAPKETGE